MINFILRAQVFYTDGTSSNIVNPLGQTSDLQLREIVTYPVGFESLNLHLLNPAKTPNYYEVWLNNTNGTMVAEKRRFYIRDEEYSEIDVWYQNSFGVVESVALRSGLTEGIKIEKEEFERNIPYLISITEHRFSTDDVRFQNEHEVSTGFLSLKELRPFIDLLISPRIWIIENGIQVPVMIPSGDFEIVKQSESEGSYDFAFNFKLIRSFKNKAFSNIHG